MTPKQVNDIFDKLPPKRRKVLVGFLAGHSREKIMIDADVPSDAALTGHLKELYKNFRIDTGWNDADDRRSSARKLPLLISLFARCMPELISDRIPEVPDHVEQEEAIAKPYQETVESDAGSIEERIFKATNQLDSDRPMFSRMSAIQALGEIAKDYPRYHWKIMELLAAFVRKAPRRKEEESIPDDIQAALTVIGRRDSTKDPRYPKLNLSYTDLRGVRLRYTNFRGVELIEANLQEADFTGAQLQEADFTGADLEKAKLDYANLQNATLCHTQLQSAFLRFTDMTDANLTYANLNKAKLEAANLQMTYLGLAKLHGAKLQRVKNLKQQQIEKANGDIMTALPDYVNKPLSWMNLDE